MNPQDPLAQLHPLREPELIGWWPLAPGWWMLIALLLLMIAAAAYWLWRRYQQRAYRRQAERQLAALLSAYQGDADSKAFVARVNSLLKAAASGEQWLALLNDTLAHSGTDQTFTAEFAEAGYRPGPPATDPELLHQLALAWIRHHKVAA